MTVERLQKILAHAGYGSRRACEDFITAGRVRVNGQIAELGQKADPAADKITVDGKLHTNGGGELHYGCKQLIPGKHSQVKNCVLPRKLPPCSSLPLPAASELPGRRQGYLHLHAVAFDPKDK